MKGSITILLVVSIIAMPILFSDARAEKSIGFKGGLTASNYWGDDSAGPDYKWGLISGIFFTYELNSQFLVFQNIAIQPEILFHSKGAKESYIQFEDELVEELWGVEIVETIKYIEIPILCRLEIPPSSGVTKGFLLLGPAFAYTMDSGYELKLGSLVSEEDVEVVYVSPRDIDIGFVVGLSAEINVGKVDLVLDLRHTLGLMSTVDDITVRNHALSLMLGAAYPF